MKTLLQMKDDRYRAGLAEHGEQALIEGLYSAIDGLEEFGWLPVSVPPDDGSKCLVIQPGSTGKHRAIYRDGLFFYAGQYQQYGVMSAVVLWIAA